VVVYIFWKCFPHPATGKHKRYARTAYAGTVRVVVVYIFWKCFPHPARVVVVYIFWKCFPHPATGKHKRYARTAYAGTVRVVVYIFWKYAGTVRVVVYIFWKRFPHPATGKHKRDIVQDIRLGDWVVVFKTFAWATGWWCTYFGNASPILPRESISDMLVLSGNFKGMVDFSINSQGGQMFETLVK
jgi:hypothetical protein